MESNILSALKAINVSELTRADWIAVGMALKEEGYPCSIWDDWPRNDSRYHAGECERLWKGFRGSNKPVKGGTIVQMAKERGWTMFGEDGCLGWNDDIEYDGDDSFTGFTPPSVWNPVQDLITYLELLFDPEDRVGYVTYDAWQDEDGKWKPSKGVFDRTAAELIASLRKHPDDIGATVGDWKPQAGAWIRFNPVDGAGVSKENVTRFHYALVESDTLPIPLFTVRTLICPEQYLPDGGFQGILDFEEKIGDVQAAFDGRLSREVFLRLAFSGDFANSYSAEDIESILRIAKQLPEGNEPRDSETGFPLFSMINVGGVPSLRYLRISLNNNIAIAGLPFCKDNTGIIIPLVEFGMNSQSEAKLGVWRFFKSFLSPNIYEGMAGNAFSLTKAGYEYALQSDRKAIADGMQLSMNINGKNEIIQITDTQDHSYCDQLLSAIHGVYHQNGRVYKLVSDSAAKYFNGDASVEATAEIILSKLSVYEAERS